MQSDNATKARHRTLFEVIDACDRFDDRAGVISFKKEITLATLATSSLIQ